MKCGPEKVFISGYFEPEFYACNVHKLLKLKQNTLLCVTKSDLFKANEQTVAIDRESHIKPLSTTRR
jgi:hypothetical protein